LDEGATGRDCFEYYFLLFYLFFSDESYYKFYG